MKYEDTDLTFAVFCGRFTEMNDWQVGEVIRLAKRYTRHQNRFNLRPEDGGHKDYQKALVQVSALKLRIEAFLKTYAVYPVKVNDNSIHLEFEFTDNRENPHKPWTQGTIYRVSL